MLWISWGFLTLCHTEHGLQKAVQKIYKTFNLCTALQDDAVDNLLTDAYKAQYTRAAAHCLFFNQQFNTLFTSSKYGHATLLYLEY